MMTFFVPSPSQTPSPGKTPGALKKLTFQLIPVLFGLLNTGCPDPTKTTGTAQKQEKVRTLGPAGEGGSNGSPVIPEGTSEGGSSAGSSDDEGFPVESKKQANRALASKSATESANVDLDEDEDDAEFITSVEEQQQPGSDIPAVSLEDYTETAPLPGHYYPKLMDDPELYLQVASDGAYSLSSKLVEIIGKELFLEPEDVLSTLTFRQHPTLDVWAISSTLIPGGPQETNYEALTRGSPLEAAPQVDAPPEAGSDTSTAAPDHVANRTTREPQAPVAVIAHPS